MLQAIEITGRTAGNRVVEIAMVNVRESVKGGGSIATPMRAESTAFPTMVTQMVAVGEETGALETMPRRSPTSTRTRWPRRSRR